MCEAVAGRIFAVVKARGAPLHLGHGWDFMLAISPAAFLFMRLTVFEAVLQRGHSMTKSDDMSGFRQVGQTACRLVQDLRH